MSVPVVHPEHHAGRRSANPVISVVIPAFNRKDDLAASLASVLAQNVASMEIIVVDDGSSDGTGTMDFASIDRRIHLVRHLLNRGGSAARNTGIDAARGELVAFLDSDDRWEPDKLRTQIEALVEAGCIARKGARLVVQQDFFCASNVMIDGAGGEGLHNRRGPLPGEPLENYLMIEGQALQTSTLLLPAALARKVRFRDGLRRHQDWDFALRLARKGARLVYLDQPLATYCLRDDPRRVTRQKGRLRATLDWYRIWEGGLRGEAMQVYFIRSILSRDLKREPWAALSGLGWLALRSRAEAFLLAQRLFAEIRSKLRGRRSREVLGAPERA